MASISELLLEKGRSEADVRRRRGERAGALVTSLGQIPAAIVADRQAQKAADVRARVEAQREARAQAEEQRAAAAETRTQTTFDEARTSEERGKQAVLGWMKQHAATLKPEESSRMEAILAMPGGAAHLIEGLSKAPAPYTLGRGEQRRGADNEIVADNPIVPVPEPPAKVTFGAPQTYRNQATGKTQLVRPGNDGKMYDARTLQPIADELQEPPSAGAMPAFQAKEVLGDDGKSVMATFDPRTGGYRAPDGTVIKNPRPVPSATEAANARKFKTAGPVFRAVSELSEKINTQQGLLAKMSGGVEKLKAQANYNDDVAEYQALIEAFTPLVARALGHTGVLTQQDVDSARAIFPKPGDSKTLRDRKITRLDGLMAEIEDVQGQAVITSPTTPNAPATPPAKTKAAEPAPFVPVGGGFSVRPKAQ